MVIFYVICLAIALFELAWLELSDVRQSLSQFVAVLAIVISDLGYIYLKVSTNFKEAFLAEKITRVLGCFLPLLFFLVVCEICHVNIHKILVLLMVSVQSVLYGLIILNGAGAKFYSTVGFYIENAKGHLTYSYGPLYMVYMTTMGVYFLAILGVSIYAMYRNKSVNNKDLYRLLTMTIVVLVAVVIDRLMGLQTMLMPFISSIIMFGSMAPVYNSNIYTVYENRNIINAELNNIGFIAFDTKLNYMGCDKFMLKLFPELKRMSVGKPVRGASRDLQRFVLLPVRYFREYQPGADLTSPLYEKKSFKLNNNYYDEKIHMIRDFKGKIKGYTLVVTDATEHHQVLELTEKFNEDLTIEVNQKTKQIRSIQSKIILGMAQVVESRDLSTGGHVKRTSDVIRIFSDNLRVSDMGLDNKFLKLVERSAPMHDIGKIGVDDSILRKNGRFTDEEYSQMKKHSEIGAQLVNQILTGVEEEQFVRIANNIAHYHHEKYDGNGYPCGLKGEEIPIEARIMAIADVFDALVSKRCYKEAYSYDKAFDIIEHDAGTHFDPQLVKIFVSCRYKLEKYYESEKRKE